MKVKEKKSKRKVRLTKRDYRILRDAARDGFVVPEFLRTKRFDGKGISAVRSTLRRLYGDPPEYRFLRPVKLDEKRTCYRLTEQGCRAIGVDRRLAKESGMRGMAGQYARIWLECDPASNRSIFDPRKFPDQFPNVSGRMRKGQFYLEKVDDNSMRVGCISIDYRSDLRRWSGRILDDLAGFIRRGWFQNYLVSGNFVVALLTYDQEKAKELESLLASLLPKSLEREFQRAGCNRLPQLEFHVVPGLLPLIPEREKK